MLYEVITAPGVWECTVSGLLEGENIISFIPVDAFNTERRFEWRTIKGVAEACEIDPYALRLWVHRAAGERPPDG